MSCTDNVKSYVEMKHRRGGNFKIVNENDDENEKNLTGKKLQYIK